MANPTIILDIGQFSSKAGFAGEDFPSLVFATRVGKPKYSNLDAQYGAHSQELYVGNEIQSVGLYKIFSPIKNGQISDWVHFQNIIDYIFFDLRIDPTVVNLLFSIHPLFPKKDIERLFELFLEHYQCMAFYPVLDSMLTLYSGGFRTGLVVEIGDSSTRIVPIYEGYKLEHSIKILDIGGRSLTRFMGKTLGKIGFSSDTSIRRELVRALKEKACFVSLDYKEDLKRAEEYNKIFSLPDGSTIKLSKERFHVPEALFQPSLVNIEEMGLPQAILEVVDSCDLNVRPELMNNIFLSGGSSMFPNIKSRLYQELELELARKKRKDVVIRILAPRERTFSVWVGGSILAMIPEFAEKWITRASYFEKGIPEDIL